VDTTRYKKVSSEHYYTSNCRYEFDGSLNLIRVYIIRFNIFLNRFANYIFLRHEY
jgi:hypothetical protein